MAAPRYPDAPLVEDVGSRPRLMPQAFAEPKDLLAQGDVLTKYFPLVTPASGNDFAAFRAPGGHVWELIGVFFRLVTGIAAGNRLSRVNIDDGSPQAIVYSGTAWGTAQTASVTVRYGAGKNTPPTFTNGTIALDAVRVMTSLPEDIEIQPGHRVSIIAGNIALADQLDEGVVALRPIRPFPRRVA